jgi:hypothetical protein
MGVGLCVSSEWAVKAFYANPWIFLFFYFTISFANPPPIHCFVAQKHYNDGIIHENWPGLILTTMYNFVSLY